MYYNRAMLGKVGLMLGLFATGTTLLAQHQGLSSFPPDKVIGTRTSGLAGYFNSVVFDGNNQELYAFLKDNPKLTVIEFYESEKRTGLRIHGTGQEVTATCFTAYDEVEQDEAAPSVCITSTGRNPDNYNIYSEKYRHEVWRSWRRKRGLTVDTALPSS